MTRPPGASRRARATAGLPPGSQGGDIPPRVLTVAGSDPMAGAGVEADLLTLAQCGVVPLAIITATVDQDSLGVRAFAPTNARIFAASIRAVLRDGAPSAVKSGMLGSVARTHVLFRALEEELPPGVPLVVDPIMRAGAGLGALARAGLPEVLVDRVRRAARGRSVVLTPNVSELAALLETTEAGSATELTAQARALHARTGAAILAKGGHVAGRGRGVDVLVDRRGPQLLSRRSWRMAADVHGTGCRLASALAAALALGCHLDHAVAAARDFLADSVNNQVRPVGRGRPQFVPEAAAAQPGSGPRLGVARPALVD